VDTEDAQAVARANLDRIIGASRTKAEPNVVVRDRNKQTIFDLIREVPRDTDLVLMEFREPNEDEGGEFIKYVAQFIDDLHTMLLVRASSRFEGASLLFDE